MQLCAHLLRLSDHRRTKMLPSLIFLVFLLYLWTIVTADPQINLLNHGCSTYNVTNPSLFLSNLNTTFSDLRSNISGGGSGVLSATSEHPRPPSPLYVLFFCRPYLSGHDCLSCLSAAATRVRRCGAGTGGRAIFDGCTLRYESAPFFKQGTLPGNTALCDNGTEGPEGFGKAADALARDLWTAAPRIAEYSAVAERDGVYGSAQCAPTVSEDVCAKCLEMAYANLRGCFPARKGRAVDAGCFMRYSDVAFFASNQTMDLAQFLRGSGGSSKTRTIVEGIAGGLGGLLVLGIVAFLCSRMSRRREDSWKGDILGATELRGPVNFHYSDLKSATKNFSQENKLGEGGFGDVYKGTLKNGKIVAVKRLAVAQTERAKESFQREVKLISNVHHRNLVRLLGCCSKSSDLLLVYEYMANGSLDKFIFGEKVLSWKQRFDIIVGMAKGIAYLHHEFHVCIIHRDIKPSNVLLDDDFQPKIADFGLVRLMPGDLSHLSTKFAGTLGYTAPEYAIHGQLTEKVDTYSFGVVILEIISGRRNSDPKLEPVNQYLLEWVWKLYEEDDLMEVIDKSLNPDEYKVEEVKRVMKIALLCTQSMVVTRPTMSEVVVLLLSQGETQLKPAKPIFLDALGTVTGEASSSAWSASPTQATISVTQISAR